MAKKVIEQLEDLQTQLSALRKDPQLKEVSIGPWKTDPTYPSGHCELIQTSKDFKARPPLVGKEEDGPWKTDPTHPLGHCGPIHTGNDLKDALDTIHKWIGYMIKVVK